MTDMKEYASALFLLAREEGMTALIYEELASLKSLLLENPDYVKLLDTPAMKKEERLALAETAFAGFSEYVRNVIMLLCEKHLAAGLPRLIDGYSALYDEECGILRAEAVTAVAMSDAQIKRLVAKLGAITGKTVVLKNTVDPTTLGGVKLRYAGNQLDGSIRAGLERFENALAGVVL